MWHVVLHSRNPYTNSDPNPNGRSVMIEADSSQAAQVTCYSGRVYADRPVSFVWQGKQHKVKEVERECQEPGEKYFQVLTTDGKHFKLWYNENQDWWSAAEIE